MRVLNTGHMTMSAAAWINRTSDGQEAHEHLTSGGRMVLRTILESCVALHVVDNIPLPQAVVLAKGSVLEWKCGSFLFIKSNGREITQFRADQRVPASGTVLYATDLDLDKARETAWKFFDEWLKTNHK